MKQFFQGMLTMVVILNIVMVVIMYSNGYSEEIETIINNQMIVTLFILGSILLVVSAGFRWLKRQL